MNTEGCPYFPVSREAPPEPPAAFGAFRNNTGLTKVTLWNGENACLVPRYPDVVEVLRDHETFSNTPTAGYPSPSPGPHEGQPRLAAQLTPVLIGHVCVHAAMSGARMATAPPYIPSFH